ncbi:MAG: hypothetical protein WC679_01925 [Bacteroidales bacterium]|jgi:hypothetical protein
MNLSNIQSEVEKNQNQLKIGSRIMYCDSSYAMTYSIIEIDGDDFVVEDEDGEKEYHSFSSLQYGWKILN